MHTPERNGPGASSSTEGCGPLPHSPVELILAFFWTEESKVMGTSNLQSTMLEGHGLNPPDLDLSVIDGKWFLYFRAKLARMVPNLG